MSNSEVSFDADELIEKAQEKSGFSDFGDLPFREGLEMLLQLLETTRHVSLV